MLAEVWGQEPAIRADTVQWLLAYQTLAYEDLSDADLQAYIDLSRSDAGQAINASLFAAFDTVFNAISHDLGRAAAGASPSPAARHFPQALAEKPDPGRRHQGP